MSREQNHKAAADKLIRHIKPQTRRKFKAEEKIRIVLAGLRGEDKSGGLGRMSTVSAERRDECTPVPKIFRNGLRRDNCQTISPKLPQGGVSCHYKSFVSGPLLLFLRGASVADACRQMAQNNIGCMVVQEDGKLTGILTDRDIALKVAGETKDSRET